VFQKGSEGQKIPDTRFEVVSPQGYAIAAAQGNTAPEDAAKEHRSVEQAAARSRGEEKLGRRRTPHRSASHDGHGKSEAPRKARGTHALGQVLPDEMANQNPVCSQCQELKNKLQIDQGAAAPAEEWHVLLEAEDAEVYASQCTHQGPSKGPADAAAEAQTELVLQQDEGLKNRRCDDEASWGDCRLSLAGGGEG
jgi:hypothetical protein